MTRTPDDVTFLSGSGDLVWKPSPPFGAIQCEFLDALSTKFRSSRELSQYPDVATFAFWCRKANILRLRDEFGDQRYRLGVGKVFHIAPSNVPVNFVYSFAFGLLSGNANWVRLPSKNFPQIDFICKLLNEVLDLPRFHELRLATQIFRYPASSKSTTEYYSSQCQGRLIWGGDETIREIRNAPISIRGVDIAFADRYSFCCLGAERVASLRDDELRKLAVNFYNDTYLMDQNACSSPHLIVWLGNSSSVEEANKRFWVAINQVAKEKYSLAPKTAFNKYLQLCRDAVDTSAIQGAHIDEMSAVRVGLKALPKNIELMRGVGGYFYEFQTPDLTPLAEVVNARFQTATYFGVEKNQIADFVMENRLTGIDRIVPVGSALDIGIVWDGYHIIHSLTRILDVK